MWGVRAQLSAPVRVVPYSESPARSGRLPRPPHDSPLSFCSVPFSPIPPSPLLPQVLPQNHSSITLLHEKLRPRGRKQPVPVGLVSRLVGRSVGWRVAGEEGSSADPSSQSLYVPQISPLRRAAMPPRPPRGWKRPGQLRLTGRVSPKGDTKHNPPRTKIGHTVS